MKAIGLDIGTTTLCAVAVDLERGEALTTITLPNDAALPGEAPWQRIQDPTRIAALCGSLLDDMLDDCPGAVSVGISGQMHGMLYLDRGGAPLGSLHTWQDGRGNLPVQEGVTSARLLAEATGIPAASGYGLVTLLYDSLGGLVPAGARQICTIGDYVGMALCGNPKPLLHPSNAAGLGGFDLEANAFAKERLPSAINPSLLPRVLDGEAVMGDYRGLPVCCALGDNQASVFGSLGKGVKALVNVGTGSQISALSHRPSGCANGIECRPYVDGKYLLVGAALCGGYAYHLLRDFFSQAAGLLGGEPPADLYRRMDESARRALETDSRLRVDTRFQGTRSDPSIRGRITGIGAESLTPGALCLGVLEGIRDELYGLSRGLLPPPQPGDRLGASGNGIRSSALMRQLFSQRFGMPLAVPRCREEAAFGAALVSAVAAGIMKYDQAVGLVQYE